jgi:hypothetical protein
VIVQHLPARDGHQASFWVWVGSSLSEDRNRSLQGHIVNFLSHVSAFRILLGSQGRVAKKFKGGILSTSFDSAFGAGIVKRRVSDEFPPRRRLESNPKFREERL